MKKFFLLGLLLVSCSGANFESKAKTCNGSECASDESKAALGKTSAQQSQLPGGVADEDISTTAGAGVGSASDASNSNANTSSSGGVNQSGSSASQTNPGSNSTTIVSNSSSTNVCVLNGKTVQHGYSFDFYSASASGNCASIKQTRTCTNGVLSGSGANIYATCVATKKFDQANCSKNNGRWIQNACWFVGNQGQSCSSVCGGKNLVNLTATAFAGSQGNDDPNVGSPNNPGNYSIGATGLCTQVLNVTLPQNRGTMNNCGPEGQGVGCAQMPDDSLGRVNVARCMPIATSADAIGSGFKRACACND